jgi:hypothetical protein
MKNNDLKGEIALALIWVTTLPGFFMALAEGDKTEAGLGLLKAIYMMAGVLSFISLAFVVLIGGAGLLIIKFDGWRSRIG